MGEGCDPPQDGEHAGQSPGVAREQRIGLVGGQLAQVSGQGIDCAVQCLVRHGLALVAAACEDDGPLLLGTVEERSHERSLADARASPDAHHPRLAEARLFQRARQCPELFGSADEPLVELRNISRPRLLAQCLENLRPRRAFGRVSLEQPDAQLFELGDEAKVEDHHPALCGHQHIRRLEIAVKPAGGVKGQDTLGELAQRGNEPDLIEDRGRRAG